MLLCGMLGCGAIPAKRLLYCAMSGDDSYRNRLPPRNGAAIDDVMTVIYEVIHLDSVERVDQQDDDASRLNPWLDSVPSGLLFAASNFVMAISWLKLRLWCHRDRDMWIGLVGLFGGFIAGVWSGIIFTNRIGF